MFRRVLIFDRLSFCRVIVEMESCCPDVSYSELYVYGKDAVEVFTRANYETGRTQWL